MDFRLKTPRRYKGGLRSRNRSAGPSRWHKFRIILLLGMLGISIYYLWIFRIQLPVYVPVLNPAPTQGPLVNLQGTPLPTAISPAAVDRELADAELAYSTGNFDEAIEHYRRAITGAPNNLLAHTRLAYTLIITSSLGADEVRLNEALAIADMAINAEPEEPDGWALKAMALLWLDRNGEAIAYAAQALKLDPNYDMAKAFMAQAYWDGNRPDMATQNITEAVNHLNVVGFAEPETIAQVFRTQGYILSSQDERAASIEAYQKAARAAPNQTYIMAELAFSYLGTGQNEQAFQLLDAALQETPDDPTLLFYMGWFYTNQGSIEEANTTFEHCIELDPNNAQCLAWLGGNKFYAGEGEALVEAIAFLNRAIDSGTTDLDVWWQLASAYATLKQCPQAVPIAREGYQVAAAALEIDPENSTASGAMDQMLAILQECNATLEES